MAGASLDSDQIVAAYRHGVAYAAALDVTRARASEAARRPHKPEARGEPRPETSSSGVRRWGWLPRVLWFSGVAAAGACVSILVSVHLVPRSISALPPASASSATAPSRAATQAHVAAAPSAPEAVAARSDAIAAVATSAALDKAIARPADAARATVDGETLGPDPAAPAPAAAPAAAPPATVAPAAAPPAAPPATVAPAVAPAAAPPAVSGVRIQLAMLRDAGNVKYVWQDFETRFAPLAANLERYVVQRQTPRGVYHMAQVGPFQDARRAETICNTMKQLGGDCLVVREP